MIPLKNVLHHFFKNDRATKPQNPDVMSSAFFNHLLSLSQPNPYHLSPPTPPLLTNNSQQTHNTHIIPQLPYPRPSAASLPTSVPSTTTAFYNHPAFRLSPAISNSRQSTSKTRLNRNSSRGHAPLSISQQSSRTHAFRKKHSLHHSATSVSRAATEQYNTSTTTCVDPAVCRKRKSPFPFPGHPAPNDTCHVHNFAPLKRPRQESTLRLLDLSDDILVSIMTHVMNPAEEGIRTIITEESIRASLPFAVTCHALYDIWRHSMHDLELWVSGKLNDRGLKAICRGSGHGIHRLGLRRCKVSQKALAYIPRQCARLRSLDISHTDISDDFVVDLTKNTGRSLQFLALHGCTKLTGRSIQAIADWCPHLRFLDIGSIPAVDDSAVCYLVRRLGTSVRTMVLSNCKDLSDFAMATIGAKCHSLMSLTIRGLSKITDDGLRKLCSGIGARVQILDVLDCTGLTMGGYFTTMETLCPYIFRYLEESNYVDHVGERSLRDNIIATMPGLIYRISATDAIRRLPALYFLLLDESTLRPFRVSVQSKSLNLSDFGAVLISNFGKKPTPKTKNVLLSRFGYSSPFDSESDESCHRV